MSVYKDHDSFMLSKQLPDSTVPVGTRGVVLHVYGGTPCEYEVEFPDDDGRNYGNTTYTISEELMKEIK